MNLHFFTAPFLFGFRVSPLGVPSFDCVRKRFSGFNRFRGFNGGGAAHKNQKIKISVKRVPP